MAIAIPGSFSPLGSGYDTNVAPASGPSGEALDAHSAGLVNPYEITRDHFAYAASSATSDFGSYGSTFEALPLTSAVDSDPLAGGMYHLHPEIFDWRDYLDRYPDLREAGLSTESDAIMHWLTHGIAERRQGSATFSVQAYLDANPDVKAATNDSPLAAIAHFFLKGWTEGRPRGDLTTPAVANTAPPLANVATTPSWAVPSQTNPPLLVPSTATQLAGAGTVVPPMVGAGSLAPVVGTVVPASVGTIPAGGLSIGNEVVQLGVTPRTGGAIDSLVYNGREYINDYDHGRQLQVAWQMNYGGEGNNPTEGGSGSDGVGPTTSSKVLAASADATSLTVTSQPAWWLQPGENVPASGAAATNGGSKSLVSNQVLTKTVEVGMTVGGDFYPNIVRHDTSITFPDGAEFVSIETPTAYLQGDFDTHYVYDIDSAALKQQNAINSNPDASGDIDVAYSQDANGPRRRPNPIVFATADGQHAMALVPSLPLPPGFDDQLLGRMSFPNADQAHATQKMTALLTASNVAVGATLSATTYVVVGTLEEVERALEALYASAPV